MANFNALVSGLPQEVDLVGDAWTDMFRKVAGFLAGMPGTDADMADMADMAAAVELADFQKMEELAGPHR